MDTRSLLSQIDAEIAKLQHARQALAMIGSSDAPLKRRGRPAKNTTTASAPTRKRRTLSPEARAKIAAAQKKRWATQKKTTK